MPGTNTQESVTTESEQAPAATATATPPPMWEQDPADSDGAAEADTTDAATEQAEATTDDAQAEQVTEATQTEQKANEKHNAQAGWDKALQQLQQHNAALERKLAEHEKLVATVKEQGGKATPQQEQQIEKVESAIDTLNKRIEGMADDEVVEASTIKAILKHQREMETKLAESQKNLEAVTRQIEPVQQDREAQRYYADFDATHPELKGRGPDLAKQLKERMDSDFPDVTDPAEKRGIARAEWKRIVAEAKTTADTAKATPAKPAAPKTVVSTKGTQIRQPGASSTRPVASASATKKPPMWVPDDTD